ncbi:MAG TPA: DUF2945 domain-containing protein [Devosia sp.]|nr:DUF2945 domain-containing protein [Devosia sp.]
MLSDKLAGSSPRGSAIRWHRCPTRHRAERKRSASILPAEETATANFPRGDHVGWNSEAYPINGKGIKVHEKDFDYKGHMHRRSQDHPKREIKSDKIDHIAVRKQDALKLD